MLTWLTAGLQAVGAAMAAYGLLGFAVAYTQLLRGADATDSLTATVAATAAGALLMTFALALR